MVVVVGVIAAAFALKDRNDDPETDPGPDPTTSQSGSTTPTSPDSSITPADGDRAKAVASLSQGLQTTGGLTEAQANCTARQWLKEDGLQAMIDDGFFDEDMVYHDKDSPRCPQRCSRSLWSRPWPAPARPDPNQRELGGAPSRGPGVPGLEYAGLVLAAEPGQRRFGLLA